MDTLKAQTILEKYNTEPFHLQHATVVSGVMRYFARENVGNRRTKEY